LIAQPRPIIKRREVILNKIERGRAAEALLESPLLRETIAALEDAYVAAWRRAATPDAREDCHRHMRLVEKFATDLQSVATSGTLEQGRIKELERGHKSPFWLGGF
jgi:hypothetical protein